MEKNLLQRLLDLSEDEIITFMGDQPLNSPEHKTAEQALEIFHRKGKQKSSFMKFLMNPWTIGIGTTVIAIILGLIFQRPMQSQNEIQNVSAGRDIKDSVIIKDLHINSQPDRHLNDEIINELERSLSSYKDSNVSVVSAGGDWEADQLAIEVTDYLKSHGWKKVFRMYNGEPMKPGIFFENFGAFPAVQIGKKE